MARTRKTKTTVVLHHIPAFDIMLDVECLGSLTGALLEALSSEIYDELKGTRRAPRAAWEKKQRAEAKDMHARFLAYNPSIERVFTETDVHSDYGFEAWMHGLPARSHALWVKSGFLPALNLTDDGSLKRGDMTMGEAVSTALSEAAEGEFDWGASYFLMHAHGLDESKARAMVMLLEDFARQYLESPEYQRHQRKVEEASMSHVERMITELERKGYMVSRAPKATEPADPPVPAPVKKAKKAK